MEKNEKVVFDTRGYFQGMENLFDERISTSFVMTQSYFGETAYEAQKEWLWRKTGDWCDRILSGSNLTILDYQFENGKRNNEIIFVTDLVASGGLKKDHNLCGLIEEGLLKTIKKDLAIKTVENFPLNISGKGEASRTLMISGGVPVQIFAINHREDWKGEDLSEKNGKVWNLLQKLFLTKEKIEANYHAEAKKEIEFQNSIDKKIVDIFPAFEDENSNKVIIEFTFSKDVPERILQGMDFYGMEGPLAGIELNEIRFIAKHKTK